MLSQPDVERCALGRSRMAKSNVALAGKLRLSWRSLDVMSQAFVHPGTCGQ